VTIESNASNKGREPRMKRAGGSVGAWALLLVVAAVLLTVDLVSKDLAFQHVDGEPVEIDRARMIADNPRQPQYFPIRNHRSIDVIPGLLDFKLVTNRGAVFGIGPGRRWFFAGFTVMALLAAVGMFAGWTTARERLAHVGIACIIAGGLGNLYDRIVFGCVRDFLHMFPTTELFPWIFNIADSVLLTGIGLLMIHFWRKDAAAARAAKASKSARG
jgi:signal peptidase II